MKTDNIAFEISPLLLASGTFGDKSGVYRYVTGLITSLGKICEKNGDKIVLFSFNQNLLLSQINPSLYEIINNKNVIFINNYSEPIGQSTTVSYFDMKNKILKFFRFSWILKIANKIFRIKNLYHYFREQIRNKNYLNFLKSELKKNDVTHIIHSNTSFKVIDDFKNIQIIYDLTPFLFPYNHRMETLDLFSRQLEFSKNHCQGIIAISNSTKKDLLKYYPIFREEKIKIIYPGVDEELDKKTSDLYYNEIVQLLKIKRQSLLKKKYLIYFGTFEPRKNIIYLVKSFIDLQNEKVIPRDFKLLLVGGEGWGGVKQKIKKYLDEEFPLISKRNIIILDYIADRFLYSLVKNAYATIYPSLYEGFGIPVLESMKLGTPVICSKNSSLTEVGGDAVLYINPKNLMDLKDKMAYLINNQQIAKEMIKKGVTQSKKFGWENTAQKLYNFLRIELRK